MDEPTESAFWRMVTGPIAGLEVAGQDWRAYRTDGPEVSGPVVGGTLGCLGAGGQPLDAVHRGPAAGPLASLAATYDEVDRLLALRRPAARPAVFDDIAGAGDRGAGDGRPRMRPDAAPTS